jgi:Fe2+ or Zn2+ uptake regulation protein
LLGGSFIAGKRERDKERKISSKHLKQTVYYQLRITDETDAVAEVVAEDELLEVYHKHHHFHLL